jgi:hypothetical protein
MVIITIVLTLIYIIWLNRLIDFGKKIATRIAIASEITAANTALIVSRLGPALPQTDLVAQLGYDAVAQELS